MAYQDGSAEETRPDLVPFQPADDVRDLVAVDGSYTFLWNRASLWLAVVRIGALHYRGGTIRRVEKAEHPVLVSTVDGFPYEDPLHQRVFELTRASRERHREMVNELRKAYESEAALQAAREGRGLIVALDGSLASFPKETDRLGEVVDACEANGHLLVGVSKDSATHAFGHPLTDEELLKGERGTAYVRVPETFEENQRGLLHGDVYFVRLHPRAPKWFRVDLGTRKDDPAGAFAQLAAYCASPLCTGYPRPLFEAHRFAVTVRQMRTMYEDAILKEGLDLGLPLEALVDGLTSMEGDRRGAFHEYLDKVTRELK